MTLKYLDRRGEPLDEIRWRQLYDDEAYRVVAAHHDDSIRLQVTWLGVWLSHYEPTPKPYCVDVAPLNAVVRRLPKATFHATEREALAAFGELKKTLFREGRRA